MLSAPTHVVLAVVPGVKIAMATGRVRVMTARREVATPLFSLARPGAAEVDLIPEGINDNYRRQRCLSTQWTIAHLLKKMLLILSVLLY